MKKILTILLAFVAFNTYGQLSIPDEQQRIYDSVINNLSNPETEVSPFTIGMRFIELTNIIKAVSDSCSNTGIAGGSGSDNQTIALSVGDSLTIQRGNSIKLPYLRSTDSGLFVTKTYGAANYYSLSNPAGYLTPSGITGKINYPDTAGTPKIATPAQINTKVAAVQALIPTTTDNLTEGTTNQYFTIARARAAFTAGANISITGGVIAATGSTGVATFNGRSGTVIPATGDYTFAQIGSTPTSLSGYGINDAYSKTQSDANYPSVSGSYSNPAWITGLAYSKITGVPAFLTANQSITFAPTGDVTGSVSGTTSLAPALVLAASGVTAGTYLYVTVDTKGRATSGTNSAPINAQTGTTYTLLSSDNGKIITMSNASAITLTVPSGLGAGFNCVIEQIGAGQVTVSASSTTIHNRQSYTKTAGQYAIMTILATATDIFTTSGDMQ